jgi:hypothetical protein
VGFFSDIAGRTLAMSLTFLAAGERFSLPHVNMLIVLAFLAAIIDLPSGRFLPFQLLWQSIVSGLQTFRSNIRPGFSRLADLSPGY